MAIHRQGRLKLDSPQGSSFLNVRTIYLLRTNSTQYIGAMAPWAASALILPLSLPWAKAVTGISQGGVLCPLVARLVAA